MGGSSRFYELLHLADSALPGGGYAFSHGLEGAYHLGLVRDEAMLAAYLQSVLWNVGHGELPFINACYRAENPADWDALEPVREFYEATLSAPAMLQGSLVQGKNWLRLMGDLYPTSGVVELKAQVKREQSHFTVVFGLSLRLAGFCREDARLLFVFHLLRDQISAAVRLGLIGPLAATVVQKELYTYCTAIVEATDGLAYQQACRCGPLLDLAQSMQPHMYTRLFQS